MSAPLRFFYARDWNKAQAPRVHITEVEAVHDDLLIRRAGQGDAGAFEALMAPHERRIYALCLRMLGNREDALDCAQDAMLRIWRAIGAYRKEASFQTWICRIATNACLDLLRRKKVRPQVSLDGLAEEGYLPAGEAADPQAQAEAKALRQQIEKGLGMLPSDLRAALVLRDVQGFSYEEVSQITGVPLGTVKSRISRARDRLRAQLEAAKEPFGDACVYTGERRQDA